jgi:hypothetical protein
MILISHKRFHSLKRYWMELFKLIQTAMPFVKELLEINQVHGHLLYEILLELVLIYLDLSDSKVRIFIL